MASKDGGSNIQMGVGYIDGEGNWHNTDPLTGEELTETETGTQTNESAFGSREHLLQDTDEIIDNVTQKLDDLERQRVSMARQLVHNIETENYPFNQLREPTEQLEQAYSELMGTLSRGRDVQNRLNTIISSKAMQETIQARGLNNERINRDLERQIEYLGNQGYLEEFFDRYYSAQTAMDTLVSERYK